MATNLHLSHFFPPLVFHRCPITRATGAKRQHFVRSKTLPFSARLGRRPLPGARRCPPAPQRDVPRSPAHAPPRTAPPEPRSPSPGPPLPPGRPATRSSPPRPPPTRSCLFPAPQRGEASPGANNSGPLLRPRLLPAPSSPHGAPRASLPAA